MRTRKVKVPGPVELPSLPPKTADEIKQDERILAQLRQLTADLRQRNLRNAVLLAQQAAAGYGPLVDHFAELGRRYVNLLEAPKKPRLFLVPNLGDWPDEPENEREVQP